MYSIYLRIADYTLRTVFHIKQSELRNYYLFKEIKNIYANLIERTPPAKIDHTIYIHQPHFQEAFRLYHFERKRPGNHYLLFYEDRNRSNIHTLYHISIMQFVYLCIVGIQRLLARDGGFILHGSASKYSGQALLFIGPSGAGKTTAMSLLHDTYPALADDSVIIRKKKREYFCYSSPFLGKLAWIPRRKRGYKLHSLFILRKSSHYRIDKVADADYLLDTLSKQLWTSSEHLAKQYQYLLKFVNTTTNAYRLSFGKNSAQMKKLMQRHCQHLHVPEQ